MWYVILFLFGLAIGSFVNVLALRYDGEHFLFDPRVIGGRSHCPHCGRTLRSFELVPVASFFIQGGRCRRCRAPLGWHYPAVELLSGVIFAAVPWRLAAEGTGGIVLSLLWVAAFEALLLMTYIDIRLQIIPDELVVLLGVIAIFAAIFAPFWISRLAGALFGGAFFGALMLATRGKGMGMGDVKLAAPLGFLFGWPDMLFLVGAAFVFGACTGVILLLRGKKTMKSAVPFAPFLALGAAFVFFFGAAVISAYFRIIGI